MTLIERDQRHIWHPYQPFGSVPPIPISSAHASLLVTEDGREIIDAISSWWVSIHGHAHPRITQAINTQLAKMHHVIFAGFTHEPAIQLAENLLSKLPSNQSKIFYSDNGSTAVEVALKICLQYWANIGFPRTAVIALEDGYHGDTFGAMSASGQGVFTKPFRDLLFDVAYLPSPLGDGGRTLEALEVHLKKETAACVILEPLVQGAGGMRIYSPRTLRSIIILCKQYHVPCIVDEVMTGFGRTGTFFASDQINEYSDCAAKSEEQCSPDLFCLSKGLTGGTLPMGVTSCSEEIYQSFASTEAHKTLFHGHSFTANVLACAAANASFAILSETSTWTNIGRISSSHQLFADSIKAHPKVKNIRQLGTLVAFDVVTSGASSYANPVKHTIQAVCLERGVFLRPLGEVVYILPPYCITNAELQRVYQAILAALDEI